MNVCGKQKKGAWHAEDPPTQREVSASCPQKQARNTKRCKVVLRSPPKSKQKTVTDRFIDGTHSMKREETGVGPDLRWPKINRERSTDSRRRATGVGTTRNKETVMTAS